MLLRAFPFANFVFPNFLNNPRIKKEGRIKELVRGVSPKAKQY